MLTIEDGIGELADPVAEDEHATGVGEHEVELDVAMTEDEVVDVGMGGQILLGIEDEMFAVLTEIRRVASVAMADAAVACPGEAEAHTEVRMEPTEEPLAKGAVEDGAYDAELGVGVAESVAVTEVEGLVGQGERHGLAVENDTALLGEIVPCPDVVVAREVVDFDAEVGELGYLTQETGEAAGYDGSVFEPEVEHVSEEIDGFGLVFDFVEETHEAALLLPCVFQGFTAQVGVREKVNQSYHLPFTI